MEVQEAVEDTVVVHMVEAVELHTEGILIIAVSKHSSTLSSFPISYLSYSSPDHPDNRHNNDNNNSPDWPGNNHNHPNYKPVAKQDAKKWAENHHHNPTQPTVSYMLCCITCLKQVYLIQLLI